MNGKEKKQARADRFARYCMRPRDIDLTDDEVFIENFNALLHDSNSNISTETLTQWRFGAPIPNAYLGYLSSFLAVKNEDLRIYFSKENVDASKRAELIKIVRNGRSSEVGFFADLYVGLEDFLDIDRAKLAEDLEVSEEALNEFAQGTALPSGKLLGNIVTAFKINEELHNNLLGRISQDRAQITKIIAPNKKAVIAETIEPTIPKPKVKIVVDKKQPPLPELDDDELEPWDEEDDLEPEEEEPEHAAWGKKENPDDEEVDPWNDKTDPDLWDKNDDLDPSQDDDHGHGHLNEDLKSEIWQEEKPEGEEGSDEPYEEPDSTELSKEIESDETTNEPNDEKFFKKFIKSGGKNAGDLVDFLYKNNDCEDLYELAEITGIDEATLKHWQKNKHPNLTNSTIEFLESYFDLNSEGAKFDLLAIARGNVKLGQSDQDSYLGTHAKILHDARDLMLGCPKPKKDENIVYDYMRNRGIINHIEEANEDTVPRALLLVMIERYAITASEVDGMGAKLVKRYKKAKERIGYIEKDGRYFDRVDRVRVLGEIFSRPEAGDGDTGKDRAKETGQLFFGIPKEIPLEKFSDHIAHSHMPLTYALERIRLQKIQTKPEFIKDSGIQLQRYDRWLNGSYCEKLEEAEAFLKSIGFSDDDPNFSAVTSALQGTLPTISPDHFEEIVEHEHERNTPHSFRAILEGIKSRSGFVQDLRLVENIKNDKAASGHVQRKTVRDWLSNGAYTSSTITAGAVADAAGYTIKDDKTRSQIIDIAMNRVPKFDPEVLDNLSVDSSDQDKGNAFIKLYENAGKTRRDIEKKLYSDGVGIGSTAIQTNLTQMSRTGTVNISEPVKRSDFLSAVADEVLFGNDAEEQKIKFMEVYKKPPEAAQDLEAAPDKPAVREGR